MKIFVAHKESFVNNFFFFFFLQDKLNFTKLKVITDFNSS